MYKSMLQDFTLSSFNTNVNKYITCEFPTLFQKWDNFQNFCSLKYALSKILGTRFNPKYVSSGSIFYETKLNFQNGMICIRASTNNGQVRIRHIGTGDKGGGARS
jgi:hypothetical protein